ncbi:MAG: hypothetical protein HUK21_05070 [Fibrobacteraceae bacterium]|nr:hypothetical protein [Fibrobacteraceae bacterium]
MKQELAKKDVNDMFENTKKDHLTYKELYELYWHCRDFEITTLWQRAIFLAPFLILCATGYGAFFLKAFVEKGCCGFCKECLPFHGIAILIAIFGIFFSILWIKMMKGSKAWYEVYERAILAMDTQKDWLLPDELLDCCGGFKYQKLPGFKEVLKENKPNFDRCLFTQKGGYFSPSKVNIAIGQVSLIFWLIVAFAHGIIGTLVCLSLVPKTWSVGVFVAELIVLLMLLILMIPLKGQSLSKIKSIISFDFLKCESDALTGKDPGVVEEKK